MMNNQFTIRVGHPLLRPGLTVETEASEGYLVPVLHKTMELVRQFNKDEAEAKKAKSDDTKVPE